MSKAKIDAMQARMDVLSLALVALAGEVPAARVAAVQELLLRGVEQRLDGVMLSAQTDAAIAADLGRLMCALRGRAHFQPGRVTLPV
jgi:hypothetical protein